MKPIMMIAATALLVVPLAAVGQITLTPSLLFEGNTTTPTQTGQPQPAYIDIQSWEVGSNNGAMQEIPLSGFYVAHLLSGNIAATIDGQTTEYAPGAFWAVRAGPMQVKVLGEAAILQTIVAVKP